MSTRIPNLELMQITDDAYIRIYNESLEKQKEEKNQWDELRNRPSQSIVETTEIVRLQGQSIDSIVYLEYYRHIFSNRGQLHVIFVAVRDKRDPICRVLSKII